VTERIPVHTHTYLLATCVPQFWIHWLVEQINVRPSQVPRAETPNARVPPTHFVDQLVLHRHYRRASLEAVKHYVDNQRNT
jgi:hypothetical protein